MDVSSTAGRVNLARAEHAAGIVRVCHRLYEAGLIAGQDGNVSVRLDANVILITPAGLSKIDVRQPDLVEMDIEGSVIGKGTISSENEMHRRIYRRRPDVNAIVHAHPPVATGFGVAGLDFMDDVLPEAIFQLGGVPLVPYAAPGTSALGDALEPYLQAHDGFLLANHGATTVGPSLMVAHQRMESLEHAARILFTARSLGRVNPLAKQDADALRKARQVMKEASGRMQLDAREKE
jgi:L-fuculose-phosphate aldolase